jgi:hypothetical protein
MIDAAGSDNTVFDAAEVAHKIESYDPVTLCDWQMAPH